MPLQERKQMYHEESIENELANLRERHLLRTLRSLPYTGGRICIKGREYLNFSSNDYLNLANNARLKTAAAQALKVYGMGATASRLMCGHLPLHEETERALAGLCGQETALLFASGYQANVGVLTALGREGDLIFSDALNHASIIDGCRLSRAACKVFAHKDYVLLERLLVENRGYRRKIIVSDAIFSMDGDTADVLKLRQLADQYGALLVIDEAHALGIMGQGAGLCAAARVQADVVVGTLSKALGSQGGFVACSETLRAYILNHARSFIYSTGLAPVCAAAALEAINIIRETPDMGKVVLVRAQNMAATLREQGLGVPEIHAPIIPVPIGSDAKVMAYAAKLFDMGIIAVGIRPPTVPAGTARLRLSLTAAHTDEDIARGAAQIAECVLGIADVR